MQITASARPVPTTASLVAKYRKVRSFHADPAFSLERQADQKQDEFFALRTKANKLKAEAFVASTAGQGLTEFSKAWSSSQLDALAELASDITAEMSPGVQTLVSLSAEFGFDDRMFAEDIPEQSASAQDEERLQAATYAAARLAVAMGSSPKDTTSELNECMESLFGRREQAWLPEEATPQSLAAAGALLRQQGAALYDESESVMARARQSESSADELASKARQIRANEKSGEHFAEKVAAAKDFLSEFATAYEANPMIHKDMRKEDPAVYNPKGLLLSYNQQMTRHDGDESKIKWDGLLKLF